MSEEAALGRLVIDLLERGKENEEKLEERIKNATTVRVSISDIPEDFLETIKKDLRKEDDL